MLAVISGLAVFVSFSGACFMSRFAYRFGLIDIPNNRSSHVLPTPRGGGAGILAAFLIVSGFLRLPVYTWMPASLLAIVSFFDDRLSLTPRTRLLFQFTAAFLVVVPHSSSLHLNWPALAVITVALTIFLVGTANFYNFMDGINGIAGMSGVVAFALLAFFSNTSGQQQFTPQLLALSAACLGFLPLNVPLARVFMGDVGSILLGFVFASGTVFLSRSFADFMLLAGCLFPFYADTLSTLYVRWKDDEKLAQAHRRHLYQIFTNRMEVAHWKVSLGYATLQLSIGLLCLNLKSKPVYVACILMGSFVAWCLCMKAIRSRFEGLQGRS